MTTRWPELEEALKRRGREWGADNPTRLLAIRTDDRPPTSHGGPSLDGCHWIGPGAFRRIAAPAP